MDNLRHGHAEMPKKFGPTIAERVSSRDMGEVFGYRLMGTMDEYIVKAIEIRLNQFVSGITDGLVRFIDETAKQAAERHVSLEIERVNDEMKSKIEIAPEASTQGDAKDANSMIHRNHTGQADTQDMDTSTSLEQNSSLNNRQNDPIVIPHDFYPKRGKKGWIDWAGSSPDTQRKIILFYLRKAEKELGVDITTGKNFLKCGTDYNGCYQRSRSLFSYTGRKGQKKGNGWTMVLEAYRNAIFETDQVIE